MSAVGIEHWYYYRTSVSMAVVASATGNLGAEEQARTQKTPGLIMLKRRRSMYSARAIEGGMEEIKWYMRQMQGGVAATLRLR